MSSIPQNQGSGNTIRVDPWVELFFKSWARFYDWPIFQEPFFRRVHAVLWRALDFVDSERPGGVASLPHNVLDLGCGTARLAEDLVRRYPDRHVVGADLTHAMLTAARSRMGQGCPPLVRTNAYALPFADRSFRLVTCSLSFHWYVNHEAALAELNRILHKGAWFVVAVPSVPLVHGVIANKIRLVPPNEVARDLAQFELHVRSVFPVMPFINALCAQRE